MVKKDVHNKKKPTAKDVIKKEIRDIIAESTTISGRLAADVGGIGIAYEDVPQLVEDLYKFFQ